MYKTFYFRRYFCIYYHDRNFDMNDYLNPLKTNYMTQFQMVDGGIRKRMTLFFKKVDFINDEGLVFQESTPLPSFTFDKMESDFTMDPSDYLFEIIVYSSLDTQLIYRRYQKIQELIASLGGISHALLFFGVLVVMVFQEYSLMKNVVNNLYSFPKNIKKTLNTTTTNNSKKSKVMKLVSATFRKFQKIHKNDTPKCQSAKERDISNAQILETYINGVNMSQNPSFVLPTSIPMNDTLDIKVENSENQINLRKKKSEEKIKEGSSENNELKKEVLKNFENFAEFRRKENKKYCLEISFWEYLKSWIRPFFNCLGKNQKQKLFEKARRRAFEEMDFFMVMRKMQEIDKIKLLLFNQQQLQLFNLISKPMIFVEDHICEEIKNEERFKMAVMMEKSKGLNDKREVKQLLEYYKKLNENKQNEIDQRLLVLVDRSLEEFAKCYNTLQMNADII